MPVRKDKNGQRSVEAQAEVPGTPEEVWRAIATGKGISSWFVPTKVEEREGGSVVSNYGPGMDVTAKITKWNPPEKFVAESEEQGLGKVASEWSVEARGGGKCIVRVVHRWFATTDDWDGQFEGAAYGWAASFFRMLRLYLAHFAGQECTAVQVGAVGQAAGPETWRTIKSALRIEAGIGRVTSAPGAPDLAGTVESLEVSDPELLRARETVPIIVAALEGMEGESPELLIRLERPAPGFAHLFIVPMDTGGGGPTMVSARFYLFGPRAIGVAPAYEAAWQAWINQRFPPAPADGANQGA